MAANPKIQLLPFEAVLVKKFRDTYLAALHFFHFVNLQVYWEVKIIFEWKIVTMLQGVGRTILLSNNAAVRVTAVRCLAASAPEPKGRRDKSMTKKAVHSKSFVQNIFRGIIEPAQAFPYPDVLNEEQRDTLQMLVDPTEKFMTEKNNALKNDALEMVPEDTVQV